jgi:cobyrinic acid a,c-diamide synthase
VVTPRLVVAAPASGHGKTTVATGLMAALRARGLAVSGHKAGPDYIDPGYHALATGRPGRNLDPVLCGADLIAPLFAHGAAGADVAVVEGVMGLFDGRGSAPEGSTAHVAALLAAPVVLVVDASAQGRSVAALVSGFASFDPAVRLAGVILNRVGSARHERILREALAGTGVPVLGALRRDDAVSAPSRHLGLIPTAEREGPARQAVARLAALVAGAVDLDAAVAVARSAGPLAAAPWDPAAALTGHSPAPAPAHPAPGAAPSDQHPGAAPAHSGAAAAGPPVVAVAGGAAFSFSYTETAELLAAAGAEVVPVDPLRDERLPAGTAALVLGGGFPEVHARELAANEPLRAEVAALARTGAPVAAECAGLLYLARDLDGAPMCGVIAASARMTGRLTLGYRDATAATDSVLAPAGASVRGHEFHRTAAEPGFSPAAPAWRIGGPGRDGEPAGKGERDGAGEEPGIAERDGAGGRAEGFVQGGVHASYLHLHWAAQPAMARRVVTAAARATVSRGGGHHGKRVPSWPPPRETGRVRA